LPILGFFRSLLVPEYAIETEGLTKIFHTAWSKPELRAVNDISLRVPKICAPQFQRKRFKISQIGRIESVYLVQSLYAPHSKEVNAAQARRLAR